jgi:hypothetical protein
MAAAMPARFVTGTLDIAIPSAVTSMAAACSPMTSVKALFLSFLLTLPLSAQTELPITTPSRDPAVGDQLAPRAA